MFYHLEWLIFYDCFKISFSSFNESFFTIDDGFEIFAFSSILAELI